MTDMTFGVFTPKPKKKSKVLSAATALKPISSRRRPLEDTSPVYGDELFQSSIKIEKQLVVSFFNLLQNNVRISTDFKFAIEWFPEDELTEINKEDGGIELVRNCEAYSLYYFKYLPSPLALFNPETHITFEIPYDKAFDSLDCILCDRFPNISCAWCGGTKKIITRIEKASNIQLLKDRLMQIVKYEYFEERRKVANIATNENADVEVETESEVKNVAGESAITDFKEHENAPVGAIFESKIENSQEGALGDEKVEEKAGSVVQGESFGKGTGAIFGDFKEKV